MLGVNHLAGFGANASIANPLEFSFQDSAVDEVDRTSYTFASMSLGAAATARRIVIGVVCRASTAPVINSLTVGGISASLIHQSRASGGAYFYYADVPTGTTGDVVVNFASSVTRAGICVWRILNESSMTPTDTASSTNADPAALNVDIPSGDSAAMAIAYGHNGTSTTWTGLTEDTDTEISSGNVMTAASDGFSTLEANRTISADFSGASAYEAGAAIVIQ